MLGPISVRDAGTMWVVRLFQQRQLLQQAHHQFGICAHSIVRQFVRLVIGCDPLISGTPESSVHIAELIPGVLGTENLDGRGLNSHIARRPANLFGPPGPGFPEGCGISGGEAGGSGDAESAGFGASSESSPGRRKLGALAGRSSCCFASVSFSGFSVITSFSLRTIFWPPTFMVSTRTTSWLTMPTKSTSCGGCP